VGKGVGSGRGFGGSLSGGSGTTPAEGKLPTSAKLALAVSKGIQKYRSFLPGEGEPGEEQLMESTGGSAYEDALSGTTTLVSTPASDLGFTL
jgi:hypothetical protein